MTHRLAVAALVACLTFPALAQQGASVNVTRQGTMFPVATGPTGTGSFIPQTNASGLLDPSVLPAALPIAPIYDFATPVTTATVTATANSVGASINPAGTIAALTIKLPPSPVDGQIYTVGFSQIVSAITWQDSGGTAGNVVGGPSASTVGMHMEFVYRGAATKWYPI